MIFLEEIVSETTVHLGFMGGPKLLTVCPGPKLLTGLLTVRPAETEPLPDRPRPLTGRLRGPEPLTGRWRSRGLLTGLPGPPELPIGLPEPPEPLTGRPGPLELLAGRPGPLAPLTVRLEGFESPVGLLVPLIDRSGPELELPFWRLDTEPELTVGRTVTVLGGPGAELELLPGCLTPGLFTLLFWVTVGPDLERLGWEGDFLALCSVADF